jgi:hypothetical protein
LEKVQQELIDLREKYKSLQVYTKDLKVQLQLKEGNSPPQKHHMKSKEMSPLEIQLKLASSYNKKQITLSDPFPNVSNDPGFFSQPRPSTEFLNPDIQFHLG